MYNRYVPQDDGRFRKSTLEEPQAGSAFPQYGPEPPGYDPISQCASDSGHRPQKIGSFFHNLLPNDLDIEDLIVILLLLLISERQEGDGNQALLTLGAYLFL